MAQSSTISGTGSGLLQQRLMRDIAELCTKPYPNIRLHHCEEDMREACLVLTTEEYTTRPLHLTVKFPQKYPVEPPRICVNTPFIRHPNVFSGYICASILNNPNDYTPAYTLKAVAIQLLSFFASDSIEQSGGSIIRLDKIRAQKPTRNFFNTVVRFACARCGYDTADEQAMATAAGREEDVPPAEDAPSVPLPPSLPLAGCVIDSLPDDMLFPVLANLDNEELAAFVRSWPRVAQLVADHDIVHQRELQCFCLKKSYMQYDLGIGVDTSGAKPTSEFDLLSREAFANLGVRFSVHHLPFHRWLPLPLSWRHWRRVRADAVAALVTIDKDRVTRKAELGKRRWQRGPGGVGRWTPPDARPDARPQALPSSSRRHRQGWTVQVTRAANALYALMTQVVVRLNQDVSAIMIDLMDRPRWQQEAYSTYSAYGRWRQSALRCVSERAIEAYFQLFHLLVCLAAEEPAVVADANARIRAFYVEGRRDKADCPDLGVLVVALLVADVAKATDDASAVDVKKAIITEAITRNVVWLLDPRGAGMAELAHLEPYHTVCPYRLHQTFVGSLTSYRLLMFMEMFRQMTLGKGGSAAATRDSLFARHGAPPPGAAAAIAGRVRQLQQIDGWPAFMAAMDVPAPTQASFSEVLRDAVTESMSRGYSQHVLRPDEERVLRKHREAAFWAAQRGEEWVPERRPPQPHRGPCTADPTEIEDRLWSRQVTYFPQ